MTGRPDPLLVSACRLALAVQYAATLLDYANDDIAPNFRRADVNNRAADPNFGKPDFSWRAARNLLQEELTRAYERDPILEEKLQALPDWRAAFQKLVKAVEWRAKKSSFTLDRATRRRLVRLAPQATGRLRRNAQPDHDGRGRKVEVWLELVHEVARDARLTGATNAGSFANLWRAWLKKSFPPRGAIIMGVWDIP